LHHDAHEELNAYEVADEHEQQVYVVPPDLVVAKWLHIDALSNMYVCKYESVEA